MQNKHCIGFLWCLLIILLAIGISAKDDDPNSHGVTCDSGLVACGATAQPDAKRSRTNRT
ncbi:MAG: hypothetical protein ACYS80_21765 [Planctomycetota bacterium]